jgi:hypothetical protein
MYSHLSKVLGNVKNIPLNGHKISCPQQQLDTEALSQSETFCEEYSKFSKLWLLNLLSHQFGRFQGNG